MGGKGYGPELFGGSQDVSEALPDLHAPPESDFPDGGSNALCPPEGNQAPPCTGGKRPWNVKESGARGSWLWGCWQGASGSLQTSGV